MHSGTIFWYVKRQGCNIANSKSTEKYWSKLLLRCDSWANIVNLVKPFVFHKVEVFLIVNWEEIDGLVKCYNISINCFNYNVSETVEKTMLHVDNNFRISLLLCAFNKKTADLSEIRQPYFYCALKKLPWKSFGILVDSVNGKYCPQPRASLVCDFK